MTEGTTGAPRTLGGRYELGELLGHGGMAEVRKAQDTRLDRTVAIKMLRTDLARDATFQARFRREAQSAAKLNAPSVVAVYDTGEDTLDGARVPYIVMEYVEGQTLRDLLRSGQRLLPTRALEIIDGVLIALDYSHRHGIIHRDVKPANVMLSSAGQVKVMDFGIARAVADSGATMTQTANVLGTAQYLSPEQARGEVVDARSDVYSAGCLLYELMTNRPPFQGESPVAVAYQHVRENPTPPSTLNPDVTPEMDAIVMKALAKNPDNRYQSAAEMRTDAQRALQGGTVAAPPVLAAPPTQPIHAITDDPDEPDKRKKGAYIALIIGVVVVLALLGAAAWAIFGGGAKSVRIDNVQGMSLSKAIKTLEAQGLQVGQKTPQPSEEKVNTVLVQNPPADTQVEEGSVVDLTFSSGPEQVQVPLVIGSTKEAAIQALETAKLVASTQTQDSDAPANTVIAADPGEGESVDVGSTVTLTISTGKVSIPNVVGKTETEARAILTNQGFDVSPTVFEETDQFPAGTVISQIPSAHTSASRGTLVTLTVAKAPPSPSPSDTTSSTATDSPGNSGNSNGNPGTSP
ncbi:MAG TPA: Stk1 family PASTA domain-containing Ser/Thr kinase [Actinomycetes bacterium]|nr:Stk1 family PASTA domain-containing Ser/Thr kinase [Actinomycetes bacterium]